jgi:transcriptional regulator with XRE-family HTH domain
MKLADRVRAYRTSRGWNTRQMGEHVGVSRQNIENVESGKVKQPREIARYAKALGVSLEEALGRLPLLGAPSASSVAADSGAHRTGQALELSLRAALERLGDALGAAPPARLNALADNLAGWARDRGADHYVPVLMSLLSPGGKPAAL